MAIKTDTFASSAAAGTDNLDDVTSRGATTTNAITVGGVTVGTEYSLPTADGSQQIKFSKPMELELSVSQLWTLQVALNIKALSMQQQELQV